MCRLIQLWALAKAKKSRRKERCRCVRRLYKRTSIVDLYFSSIYHNHFHRGKSLTAGTTESTLILLHIFSQYRLGCLPVNQNVGMLGWGSGSMVDSFSKKICIWQQQNQLVLRVPLVASVSEDLFFGIFGRNERTQNYVFKLTSLRGGKKTIEINDRK